MCQIKRVGIKNLEAGIGCGVGLGHGFGVGLFSTSLSCITFDLLFVNFPPIMCSFREVQLLVIISGSYLVISSVCERWFKVCFLDFAEVTTMHKECQ